MIMEGRKQVLVNIARENGLSLRQQNAIARTCEKTSTFDVVVPTGEVIRLNSGHPSGLYLGAEGNTINHDIIHNYVDLRVPISGTISMVRSQYGDDVLESVLANSAGQKYLASKPQRDRVVEKELGLTTTTDLWGHKPLNTHEPAFLRRSFVNNPIGPGVIAKFDHSRVLNKWLTPHSVIKTPQESFDRSLGYLFLTGANKPLFTTISKYLDDLASRHSEITVPNVYRDLTYNNLIKDYYTTSGVPKQSINQYVSYETFVQQNRAGNLKTAAAIPSFEGKSTLARQHPDRFVDHDVLLTRSGRREEHAKLCLDAKSTGNWEQVNALLRSVVPQNEQRSLLTWNVHTVPKDRLVIGNFLLSSPPQAPSDRPNQPNREAILAGDPDLVFYYDTHKERNDFLVSAVDPIGSSSRLSDSKTHNSQSQYTPIPSPPAQNVDLSGLLARSGDVHPNPGPPSSRSSSTDSYSSEFVRTPVNTTRRLIDIADLSATSSWSTAFEVLVKSFRNINGSFRPLLQAAASFEASKCAHPLRKCTARRSRLNWPSTFSSSRPTARPVKPLPRRVIDPIESKLLRQIRQLFPFASVDDIRGYRFSPRYLEIAFADNDRTLRSYETSTVLDTYSPRRVRWFETSAPVPQFVPGRPEFIPFVEYIPRALHIDRESFEEIDLSFDLEPTEAHSRVFIMYTHAGVKYVTHGHNSAYLGDLPPNITIDLFQMSMQQYDLKINKTRFPMFRDSERLCISAICPSGIRSGYYSRGFKVHSLDSVCSYCSYESESTNYDFHIPNAVHVAYNYCNICLLRVKRPSFPPKRLLCEDCIFQSLSNEYDFDKQDIINSLTCLPYPFTMYSTSTSVYSESQQIVSLDGPSSAPVTTGIWSFSINGQYMKGNRAAIPTALDYSIRQALMDVFFVNSSVQGENKKRKAHEAQSRYARALRSNPLPPTSYLDTSQSLCETPNQIEHMRTPMMHTNIPEKPKTTPFIHGFGF